MNEKNKEAGEERCMMGPPAASGVALTGQFCCFLSSLNGREKAIAHRGGNKEGVNLTLGSDEETQEIHSDDGTSLAQSGLSDVT